MESLPFRVLDLRTVQHRCTALWLLSNLPSEIDFHFQDLVLSLQVTALPQLDFHVLPVTNELEFLAVLSPPETALEVEPVDLLALV